MNANLEPSVVDEPLAEPTLGEVLTRAVRTAVPTRLYQIFHLALPLAVDFAFRGWWRPAAAATALTAFGAWGLADRWIWSGSAGDLSTRWTVRLAQVARAVAGTVAAALAAGLALELFLRVLGNAPVS